MKLRFAVIGAGSWGTTVANLLVGNAPTILWARREEVAEEIRARHTNETYLPGAVLDPALEATSDLGEAVSSADVVVMAVPSHGFRLTLLQVAEHIRPWVPVVSLTKGLEQDTHFRMTQVIESVLPGHVYGVLTGPNLAGEILAGHAAASVLSMSDRTVAEVLQPMFARELFRVYTNDDIVGCELGGALKNVIAIAAGMADGLGAGDNTKAAVITRGLAELTRLGVALGGQPMTFSGLTGMGDLLATCISPQSRNRYVGEQLGRGRSLEDIVAEMKMVAEGIRTSKVVMELAEAHGVEMPIAEQVYRVLHEGRPATDAYKGLLRRPSRPEMHSLDGDR
ncbi:MAG: glycerol-3-phosphate dehydrogenase [NAD(P)+] [Acidimicrobiales bacterium]|nr:MAG: glycerol-3-phosphate dehydrogenase [NAD(P)+] [Acidimicrobiales bacterium]